MDNTPYTVLARRFRPQTFDEVVGQERIAQALRQRHSGKAAWRTRTCSPGPAASAKRRWPAFSPRRSTARTPWTPSPATTAKSAAAFPPGSDVDVLGDRRRFEPRHRRHPHRCGPTCNVKSMRSKYKVYIIDEVHMLTKEAFNALLKTLEEPPPNVKFIFCTTEPNKVPGHHSVAVPAVRLRHDRHGGDRRAGSVRSPKPKASKSNRRRWNWWPAGPPARCATANRCSINCCRSVRRRSRPTTCIGCSARHRDERVVGLVQALIDRRRDVALQEFHAALQNGVQIDPFTDQLIAYVRDLMVLAAGAVDRPVDERRQRIASTSAGAGQPLGVADDCRGAANPVRNEVSNAASQLRPGVGGTGSGPALAVGRPGATGYADRPVEIRPADGLVAGGSVTGGTRGRRSSADLKKKDDGPLTPDASSVAATTPSAPPPDGQLPCRFAPAMKQPC